MGALCHGSSGATETTWLVGRATRGPRVPYRTGAGPSGPENSFPTAHQERQQHVLVSAGVCHRGTTIPHPAADRGMVEYNRGLGAKTFRIQGAAHGSNAQRT